MDEIVNALTWQSVLFSVFFSVGVYIIIFIVRRIAEVAMKNLNITDTHRLWRDAVLPILPAVLGAVLASTLKNLPYPPEITNISTRILFGGVCGFFSAGTYRFVKSFFAQKEKNPEIMTDDGSSQFNNP